MSHYISFIRIPALVLRQHIRPLPPLAPLEPDQFTMRVWPNSIDLNLHLNNARYLSFMDYGRTHLLARSGLLTYVLRARWMPVAGAVWMTYRRSLPLFAQFTLTSRLVCWDDRWFYIEQVFTGQQGLAAIGWVKTAFRSPQGIRAPQSMLETIQPGIVSPPIPETIATWNNLTREKLQSA